jgi:hypothetical protein
MQDDMVEASRIIDESITNSGNSAIIREFDFNPLTLAQKDMNKVRIAITKADPFVNRSLLLAKIIDDNKIDVAIAYTQDGKLSLRRRKMVIEGDLQIDCSAIASAFREGGEHAGAARGFLRTKIEQDGDASAVCEIEVTIRDYLKKLQSNHN